MKLIKHATSLALPLLVAFVLLATAAAGNVRAQSLATQELTLLPLTSYTATTVTSTDRTNTGWRGLQFSVYVATATSGTYTATLQGKDPTSGQYYTLLQGPALATSASGTINMYQIGPGLASSVTSFNVLLPRTWRLLMTGASTPNMRFSVGGVLVP